MTNCWTLSNRGPFNPYSAGAFFPPSQPQIKKIFDFDIKEAQDFFFFFLPFLMRMKMLSEGVSLHNKNFQFNQIIELNGG